MGSIACSPDLESYALMILARTFSWENSQFVKLKSNCSIITFGNIVKLCIHDLVVQFYKWSESSLT